jgi:hypothetical protein
MAITTYDELKTAIASWLHRSDLDAIIPSFISLAESKIGSGFRSREQETSTNLVTVAGVETVALPADYHSLKSIQIVSSFNSVLRLMPDDAALRYKETNTLAQPEYYTIQGSNLRLSRCPDAVYTLEAIYYAKVPALSGAAQTNWLLTKAPQLYLYGGLVEAMLYVQDDERLQLYAGLFDVAMNGVIASSNIESYSGAPLRAVSDYVC